MLKKVHLRLTLLSGGITTLVLIIMTLGYLYISEKNLLENKLFAYQNDIYTTATSLEQQTVISHTWLSSLEGTGNYYVSLMDNKTPFLFNSREQSKEKEQLLENIWHYYREHEERLPKNTISYRSRYTSFLFTDKEMFYCFVISVDQDVSNVEMLLVSPLKGIHEQLFRQRLIFLAIILLAFVVVWIFAWVFTGRLLLPIEESRRKQNEFVAAASHELRTPLAVILCCAESDADKNPDRLSIIKSEALQMSSLLEDLLTLSSSDANRFEVKKAPVELDTLLLDSYEAFEMMAKSKNIGMSIQLPEGTLPCCHCDKTRINQVIRILLHNAISYTPEHGHISLSVGFNGSFFSFVVSDTGVGIPDEEKDKIFDRFYRSDQSRTDKGHFGLGLSIASEIVAAHNGSIKVSDTSGGGATFTILLP